MALKHLASFERRFKACRYSAAFVRPIKFGTGVSVRCLGRFETVAAAKAAAEKCRSPGEEVRSVFAKKMGRIFLGQHRK